MSVYSKFYNLWKNKPDKTTPATAEAMNHIEDGIVQVSEETTDSINDITEHSAQIIINSIPYHGIELSLWKNDDTGIPGDYVSFTNPLASNDSLEALKAILEDEISHIQPGGGGSILTPTTLQYMQWGDSPTSDKLIFPTVDDQYVLANFWIDMGLNKIIALTLYNFSGDDDPTNDRLFITVLDLETRSNANLTWLFDYGSTVRRNDIPNSETPYKKVHYIAQTTSNTFIKSKLQPYQSQSLPFSYTYNNAGTVSSYNMSTGPILHYSLEDSTIGNLRDLVVDWPNSGISIELPMYFIVDSNSAISTNYLWSSSKIKNYVDIGNSALEARIATLENLVLYDTLEVSNATCYQTGMDAGWPIAYKDSSVDPQTIVASAYHGYAISQYASNQDAFYMFDDPTEKYKNTPPAKIDINGIDHDLNILDAYEEYDFAWHANSFQFDTLNWSWRVMSEPDAFGYFYAAWYDIDAKKICFTYLNKVDRFIDLPQGYAYDPQRPNNPAFPVILKFSRV